MIGSYSVGSSYGSSRSNLNSIFYGSKSYGSSSSSNSSSSSSTSSTSSTSSSSNVSSSDGLTGFEKEIYEEIETLFENNAHSDMLTNSVHITDDAMALMESDEDFKKEMMTALVEQIRTSAGTSDGYHGVIKITTSGLSMSTTTVSTYESTTSKEAKEETATKNASGSFFTYGISDSDSSTSTKSSLLDYINGTDDDSTSTTSSYESSSGLSYYSQSLLNAWSN